MDWIDLFPEPKCVPLWSCIVLSWSCNKAINIFSFPQVILWVIESVNCQALAIPAANVSDDELDTDTASDDEIISEAEEEILEESSGKSQNESEIVKIEGEDNSIREIEFNWQINRDWTIPVVSQFKEKKLQLN